MTTTAFFVFAEECPSCIMYKEKLHPKVKEEFERKNVQVVEKTAKTFKGLGQDAPYKFLEYAQFFPCILLIKTELLREVDSMDLSDVFSRVSIYNGVVTYRNRVPQISVLRPGQYGASIQEFVRFLSDFEESLPAKKEIKSQERKPVTNSVTPKKINYCSGIVAVGTYRK